MADSKKVNFFVVGQPKTGTTSLYHYFKKHPEIFTPEQKQLYHFAKDHNLHRQSIDKYRKDYYRLYYNYSLKDYHKHYEFTPEKLIYCDITPDYLYSDVAHDLIHNYNKEAKILILLREPASFLRSFHNQLVNSGNEFETNFHKALALEPKRINAQMKQNPAAPPQYFQYSQLVNYQALVKKYHALFGENVKIIPYESFKNNNMLYLEAVYKWLGLSIVQSEKRIVANISSKNKFGFIRKLKSLYFVRIISSMIPSSFKNYIKRIISEKKYETVKADKSLDIASDSDIREKLKEEVFDTNNYLKRNNLMLLDEDLVKIWGY